MGCSLSSFKRDNNEILDKPVDFLDRSLPNKKENVIISEPVNFDIWTYYLTPDFSLNNSTHMARVVDIYDGDTITCVLYFNNNYYKFHVRLNDIDTCEIDSKFAINKELAHKARNRLYELITSKKLNDLYTSKKDIRQELNSKTYLVKLSCNEFDKYGRLLAFVYPINSTINELNKLNSYNNILIIEKLAYIYHGKTKLSEEEQIKKLI